VREGNFHLPVCFSDFLKKSETFLKMINNFEVIPIYRAKTCNSNL